MTPSPALLAPTAAPVPAPEFPGPYGLPLARVKFIVPVDALFAPDAPVADPPVEIPFNVKVPVDAFRHPNADALVVPPRELPVSVTVPVELFNAPTPVLLPPVAFPVIEIDPVDEF
jgi:hypothetical protein